MVPALDTVPVLYADDYFLVVDKPAGLVVHPTYKNADGTLLDILRQQLPDPPSIVGRLDRWTSGVVLVARNSAAHAALQRAMSADDCRKDYIALVHGRVTGLCDISLRLRVDENDRRRVIASTELGAPSRTEITGFGRAMAGWHSLTMVHCRPVTGRRHQIRAHLAARGWPIVGDAVYGDAAQDRALLDLVPRCPSAPRQALHACRLSFTHPFSSARLRIASRIPDDLESLMRLCALDEIASTS